jgi:hypothetical protein
MKSVVQMSANTKGILLSLLALVGVAIVTELVSTSFEERLVYTGFEEHHERRQSQN